MPDLVTHFAGAWLAGRAAGLKRFAPVFYLGAILPDLVTRPIHIVWPRAFPATQPFHAPAVLFFLCWLLALCFRRNQRVRIFWLLYGGCLLHAAMDMLQKHLVGGYMWLYPFTTRTFSLGFVSPDRFVALLPLTLAAVLVAALLLDLRRRRRRRGAD
ncbi:MAG TPA: hypothetical protein PK636_04295 [bacterium]|nr:hypothetical protein [bacterium]HPJ71885.1 hypothetical protein [bacterium]HPQ66722.1 hypothetical protein [bacterium]